MKKRNQRFLSLLLALLMAVSLLPTAAFAAARGEDAIPVAAPAADEDTLSTPAVAVEDDIPAVPVVEEIPAELAAVTNIALGKATSASSDTDQGFPSERAVDGNDGISSTSYWATGWGSTQLPSWLQIDLGAGASAIVESMVIKFRNDQYSNDYTIATSATAAEGSWTTVYTLSNRSGAVNNQEDTISYTDGSSGLTQNTLKRYVRITFTSMAQPTKSLSVLEWKINGELTENVTPDGNLCRPSDNATVTATVQSVESNTSFTGDKVIDGNQTTRWSTDRNAEDTSLVISLGALRTVSSVVSYWCGEGQSAVSGYTISVSNSATGPWETVKTYSGTVVAVRGDNDTHTPIYDDFDPVAARYVKLESTGYRSDATWKSMALWEVEVYRDHQAPYLPETPSRNLCRPTDGVTVTATAGTYGGGPDEEADSVRASNAIDGDSTSSSSRWGSKKGDSPHSLTIDLGALRAVSVVKIFWERRNVLAYTLEGSTDNQNWTTLYTCNSEITTVNETLTFSPAAIRYLKLNITSHKSTGIKWDGTESIDWNTVSLFEIEAYRDANAIPQAASAVLETITSQDAIFALQGGKLILHPDISIPEDFTVTFAANLEQVVGKDHTVYTPVVDKEVAIDLTVTDDADPANTATTPGNGPIRVTIPGENAAAANNGNPKPAVIPEIMEWYSPNTAGYYNQSYTLGNAVRILYRYAFADVAKELQADLKDLYGIDAELKRLDDKTYTTLQTSGILQNGDIVLFDVAPNNNTEDPRNRVKGYDEETYGMEIYDNKVYIYATHPTGAYWGTRTLLQGMKLSEDGRSFPNGTLRDYPEFKVRGFMLDVGRKPESIGTLYTIAKNMAWYKLNDFHIHLSDNLIFMEDYCTQSDRSDYQSAYEAYSAFRLESNVQEEAGAKPLTAKDYAYTKAEFKQFIKDSAALGINIVPEFDVPAHAKAITDAFPSLRLNKTGTYGATTRPWIDHLDLTNKMDESLAKVQEIFDEYITGSDPVFSGDIVHFGADEYYDDYAAYAPFAKAMVDYIQSRGKTVRMWGSLSSMGDSNHLFTKEVAQNIQMNIWSTGWANPTAMYNLGFNLINITDGPFYMVPDGGGGRGAYGDYLNLTNLYNKAPNQIGNDWFPASSSQILGESVGMWQDNIDTHASGLDEVDMVARFLDAIPVAAVRQWGVENNTPERTLTELQADAAIIGTAPQTDPYYYKADETDFFTYDFSDKTDKSGNGHDLTLTNAEVNSSKSLLVLKGGASYAETGLDRLGWSSQLSFRALKLTGGGEEEILFEADHAYGDYAIKALPVEGKDNVWKLGFSRELYDYEFDVELPVGQWVKLTLTTAKQSTTLSVDGGAAVAAVGKFVSKPDSNTQFQGKTGITNSSFELPVARIGSKQNAFRGYVAAVTTGEPIDIPFMTASSPSFNSDGIPFKAIDGDTSTIYHSNYTESAIPTNGPFFKDLPAEQRYIQLDLTTPVTLSGLKHLRRQSGTNGYITSYDIRVSTDGETYTSVKTGSGWSATNDWDTATFTPQSGVVSVRLYRTDTSGDFMSVAELELVYEPIDLAAVNATVTVGDVTWGETEATAEVTVALESGFVLTEGADYEVTYTNNTAAGTATATVTGTGGYTGSVSATFTVPAKPVVVDLSTATVTFALTSYPLEDGKAEPDPIVKVGDTTLLRGLDYDVTYENNTATGTATATVTGIGDYTGEKTATFTVTPAIVKKNLSDTAKTKVTLSQTTFPYDGAAITPEVVVTYDGETLTKGTHYTVSYARNNAVGTATVTVVGRAPYCEGSASATFTIVDPSKGNDLSDVTKTVVTLTATQYEYTGQPIIPEFTVRYNGVRLTRDTDYTVELSRNVNGGTGVLVITGIGDYYGSYVTTFTINGGGTGAGDVPGNSSGSSSSGSGSSVSIPSPVVTSTETTKGDGVTTTVKTDSTGAMIAQSTYDDGTKVIADIPVIGPVTAVVTVPSRVDAVTVTIPTRGEPTPGQVAVILHPDGTEEIVKTSLPTEDGVELTLDASATVQIVDNAKAFTDVPANSWAKDAIDFVTSREIFNGTGNSTFTPTGGMSRAMVCTVLANLAGEDTKGGATWYGKAVDWAQQSGVSDGSRPNDIVTREQLAAMLYRYAGSPTVVNEVPRRFRDRNSVSDWAEVAVTWAVENDLIRGRSSDDGLDLAPQATASRAEVAAVFQRYVALLK